MFIKFIYLTFACSSRHATSVMHMLHVYNIHILVRVEFVIYS